MCIDVASMCYVHTQWNITTARMRTKTSRQNTPCNFFALLLIYTTRCFPKPEMRLLSRFIMCENIYLFIVGTERALPTLPRIQQQFLMKETHRMCRFGGKAEHVRGENVCVCGGVGVCLIVVCVRVLVVCLQLTHLERRNCFSAHTFQSHHNDFQKKKKMKNWMTLRKIKKKHPINVCTVHTR